MKLSEQGVDFVKFEEGLELVAYIPAHSTDWTIGYGHTKGVCKGLTCIESQAAAWLDEDADEAESAVRVYTQVTLSQTEFDALTSFVFNVGVGAYRRSTLLRLLNQDKRKAAANQFKEWKYQDGKVLNGLVARRKDEEQLFLRGDYAKRN